MNNKDYNAFRQNSNDNDMISECELNNITFSNRFKRKMNRIFREQVGAKIPHPEVDNLYERVRSFFIRNCILLKRKLLKK